ncbi:4333_t:CDS:2 [Diversispora eburnea]|uniref:4333_t:CDS:1 n=1 Tax=Diversispora eburnea TaxID=1213867 RepID=A0A9N9G2L9_9GLOM|nr:4333_t:CDS:2 [Diversispora eburnea]
MSLRNDIEIIVAIDFGTKYSHKKNPEIIINDSWPGQIGALRTNTALQYDENYENVLEWGYEALIKEPQRKGRDKNFANEPVELFKLHLSAIPDSEKPPLPRSLDYKKAITDYLREMVLTVPEEYPEKSKRILRECVYNAGLIDYLPSERLFFSTEPEAVAIYCMQILKELEFFGTSEGKSFLVANCDDAIVNLTTYKFISTDTPSDVIEHTSDFCGNNYVDKEFTKLLKRYVGDEAIKILEERNYGQMLYMMQAFRGRVKYSFSGIQQDFKLCEFDLERLCPAIMKYVTGSYKEKLEKDYWIIGFDFETTKSLFDPIIEKIIRLISGQLKNRSGCDVMFLLGGLSDLKYFRKRISEEFENKVKCIFPRKSQTAIVQGAVEYGLKMEIIKARIYVSNVWYSQSHLSD